MSFNCPGSQRFKQPQPEIINCPFCADEIELWTDEAEAVCSTCKRNVTRESGNCCLDWCAYARGCVGEAAYDRYVQNKRKGVQYRERKEKENR